jgi:hypothetical protein
MSATRTIWVPPARMVSWIVACRLSSPLPFGRCQDEDGLADTVQCSVGLQDEGERDLIHVEQLSDNSPTKFPVRSGRMWENYQGRKGWAPGLVTRALGSSRLINLHLRWSSRSRAPGTNLMIIAFSARGNPMDKLGLSARHGNARQDRLKSQLRTMKKKSGNIRTPPNFCCVLEPDVGPGPRT